MLQQFNWEKGGQIRENQDDKKDFFRVCMKGLTFLMHYFLRDYDHTFNEWDVILR
jgi:hypothetical protein